MSSKDLTQALHDMMQQNVANVVPAPQPRGAAPKAKSAARLPGSSGGGGAGSDLAEQSYAAREFWPNAYTSTDGLFLLPAVKKLVMTDVNNQTVNITFAAPP